MDKKMDDDMESRQGFLEIHEVYGSTTVLYRWLAGNSGMEKKTEAAIFLLAEFAEMARSTSTICRLGLLTCFGRVRLCYQATLEHSLQKMTALSVVPSLPMNTRQCACCCPFLRCVTSEARAKSRCSNAE